MSVRVEKNGDVAIVSPEGNFFGGKETDELSRVINEMIESGNTKMVLDLGKVVHLNSIAIGILVRAYLNYQKRSGRIILANVDKRIQNVFVITKLSLVFEVTDTRQEALAALGA